MTYTEKIDDAEVGMSQILNAALKFNSDRFLYALQYKNWDERTIETMSEEVASSRLRLEKEYERLAAFAKTFNKEFATDKNDCFDTALVMLRKLRSGISQTKKIFKRFCPRARKNEIFHAIGQKPASAYEYARISADVYQLPLFSFEEFPACIGGLYHEMEKFFVILIKSIQLCKQVLKDEQDIKKDHKYCLYLFGVFKQDMLKQIHDIIMIIQPDSHHLTEEGNPAIASRSRYADDAAWAPVGFHQYDKRDVKLLVIKQTFDEKAESDLTKTEILLFGNDQEKVHTYRRIIQHFDELIPESHRRKVLPAKLIQMFFQYVGIQPGHEKIAASYFNDTYNASPNHKYATIGYTTINGYKREVLKDKDGYNQFVQEIRNHFLNTSSSYQMVVNRPSNSLS